LKYNFEIKVNFIGIDKEQAEEIFKITEENPKKTIGNARIFEITNRFWHRILWLSKVDLEKIFRISRSKNSKNSRKSLRKYNASQRKIYLQR
jgi:hypothetical protein